MGFLTSEGLLGIAGAGLVQEIEGEVPAPLKSSCTPEHWCLHSADWWRRHWERTGLIKTTHADTMPEGWLRWLDWQQSVCPENTVELETIQRDRGQFMGYIRAIGHRLPGATLEEQVAGGLDPRCVYKKATAATRKPIRRELRRDWCRREYHRQDLTPNRRRGGLALMRDPGKLADHHQIKSASAPRGNLQT
jgi:hypothetical protein